MGKIIRDGHAANRALVREWARQKLSPFFSEPQLGAAINLSDVVQEEIGFQGQHPADIGTGVRHVVNMSAPGGTQIDSYELGAILCCYDQLRASAAAVERHSRELRLRLK